MRAPAAALALLLAAGPSSAQAPPASGKPVVGANTAPPIAPDQESLIDLSRIDFSRRTELASAVARLDGTFQSLTRDPSAKGEQALAAEGGPGLRAQCTMSYVGGGRVVSAGHCLWRHEGDFKDVLVLRRHRFVVQAGKLARAGFQDYKLSGRYRKLDDRDLVILELAADGLAPPEGARFSMPPAGARYEAGQSFEILGFPNHLYAVPYLSRGCRIARVSARGGSYEAGCTVVPGMSGGPHFTAEGVQLGVTSQSIGADDKSCAGAFLPAAEK